MTGLGARIAAARAHANLSQATLGHRLGVGQTCVSYWEKDKREPGLAEMIGLARELGVTLAHLVGTDTSEAESYWVGWRAGWLACAENARAAVALDPRRFPPRDGRTAAGMPEPDSEPEWMRAVQERQVRGGEPR
jgi:transcriptional regulator with XRE-family HTH domain